MRRSIEWHRLSPSLLIAPEEFDRLERDQNVRNHNAYNMLRHEDKMQGKRTRTSGAMNAAKLRCEELGGHWPTVRKWLGWYTRN